MFSLENEFHATITASFEGATTAYPVPLSVSFTQSVQQITQSQLIVCISVWLQAQVTNAVVSSFTQVSLTELTLALTPQEPGEITLTLDTSVKSVSGRTLAAPPSFAFTYKGAVVSQSSVLAYDRYALLSVTASKPAHLYCLVFPKKLAVTPSVDAVMNSGVLMTAADAATSYTANITSLAPQTEYVVFVAGREPFGPRIATPVADTRTAFTTVRTGEKPSTGTQCPKGWAVKNNLLLFSQCSDHGVCVDGACVCSSAYTGPSCGAMQTLGVESANTTHHLVHTALTVSGALPASDEDQDTFLQTSLQLGPRPSLP